MPKNVTVLRVFAASPADLQNERVILEEVINELNLGLDHTGTRLELVKWETHAYPGINVDAQAVVNEQINDEYDIFVGILWKRFGTPSNRAESGTAEEFERAHKRHIEAPQSISVMVYFKDQAVPPSEIDPQQLGKIQKFQNSLGDLGVLYWKFKDRDDFSRFLRLHLARAARDWTTTLNQGKQTPTLKGTLVPEMSKQIVPVEEDGLLDLMVAVEDSFENGSASISRIGEAMMDMTAEVLNRTNELNSLRSPNGQPIPREVLRITNRVADSMEVFAARAETEIPIFSPNISNGFDAMIRGINLAGKEVQQDAGQIRTVHAQTVALQGKVADAQRALGDLGTMIAAIPNFAGALNRAKRHITLILKNLDSEFEKTITLSNEVLKSLNVLIPKS